VRSIDPLQRVTGFGDEIHALSDLLGRGRDQRLDLLGRRGRALGQGAHFGRDHGETAPSVARPRRLNPGVERQQISLESDLIDHADDLADPGLGKSEIDGVFINSPFH
jgi:hypothetical protein